MTHKPTAKRWEHVRGVTYPKTSMTEAQMDAERARLNRERRKAEKRATK